jgi:hypothetical protein
MILNLPSNSHFFLIKNSNLIEHATVSKNSFNIAKVPNERKSFQLSLNLHSVNVEAKIMKRILVFLFVLCLGTSVYAACAHREKPDDLFDDIKCGLSSAGDKLKDSASTVGSSLKDGTMKAFEVLSKAAVKTGYVLRDGLSVAVETGKQGFDIVRDAIKGKKSAELQNGDANIDVRMANEP